MSTEKSAFLASLTPDQRTIHDALCDSAWRAGLGAGWNAGCIKNDAAAQKEFDRLARSRDGHLQGYAEAKKRLEAQSS